MSISVSCPKCQRKYQVRDELAGKVAKCQCGETLHVPVRPPLAEEVPTAEPVPVAEPVPTTEPVPVAQPVSASTGAGPSDPSGDLFSQLDNELASQGSSLGPLQPLAKRRKKRSQALSVSPMLIWFLLAGLVASAAIAGVVFLVVKLSASMGPRWNTPEEVFAAYQQARKQGDWRLYYDTHCPEEQDDLARNAATTAMAGASECPALDSICTRYGFEPVDNESMEGNFEKQREFYQRLREKIGRMSNSKKARLFAETVEVLSDKTKLPKRVPYHIARSVGYWRRRGNDVDKFGIVNVKITGDTATADKGTIDDDDPTKLSCWSPQGFSKVNGEWRLGPTKRK